MTAANEHRYDTGIPDALARRMVVGDGAMGTQLQAADLSLDDYNNRRRAVETKYVRLQTG